MWHTYLVPPPAVTIEVRADNLTIDRPRTGADWARAEQLLWSYVRWIRAVSGLDPLTEQPSFRVELDSLEQTYGGADADFFVATVGGDQTGPEVVGTVAVRHHDDGGSELKRLFVVPAARGRGIADRLVAEVVAEAGSRGAERVWLESVRGFMDPAIELYRKHGFVVARPPGRTFAVEGMVYLERTGGPSHHR